MEILIALAIIGAIIGIGIPKLNQNLGTQVKAVTRKLITLTKELHHSARIRQKTYRLVFEFGDPKQKDRIYIESAATKELVTDPEDEKNLRDDEKPPSPFSPDLEVLKKPIYVPDGAVIESVEVQDFKEIVTKGTAYIYFFPEGLNQKAVIGLSNGKKMVWSLILTPLTGELIVKTEKVSLKDLK